jgi:hypothetical protein
MSKQLYDEALADVKKVKQVAEGNATRAVLEAVTPRIREFIDQALLNEGGFEDEEMGEPGAPPVEGELITDLTAADPAVAVDITNAGPAAAMSAPDLDGKVTLDLDGLCCDDAGAAVPAPMFGEPAMDDDEVFEINIESIDALSSVAGSSDRSLTLESEIRKLNEQIAPFKAASAVVRKTGRYRDQIARMISRVEDMYAHVQEQATDPAKKNSYEAVLEASFKVLNKLQEPTTMSNKTNKRRMNEADVTLKLTGLPDDVDLDSVGVDLITGDEDEEGGESQGGDDAVDFDDLGMDDQGGQGEQDMSGDQLEALKLSDDTIVEIDEKMLKSEISRMQRLRENHTGTGGSETKPQSWGHGPGGSNILDDFGGGDDEGEPTEAEIVDKSPSPGALPLGEADEDLDEVQDQMDETDDMDEAIDAPAHGGDETMPSNEQSDHAGESFQVTRQEGLRRLGHEKKLQERAKARASQLRTAAKRARGSSLSQIQNEYRTVAQRYNESLARSKKMKQLVAEATQKLRESRSNSGAARPAENQAVVTELRKKLTETNLFNAKLLYTNRILQNEQLTSRQKAQVIKQLDSAKTLREAKLVYESLSNTLASSAKPVNESRDRTVLGSGSRATRPASTQTLNEGYEAERWAKLAGITKR